MNKRGKQVLLFSLIALVSVIFLSIFAFNLIFAASSPMTLNVQLLTPTINEDTSTIINFSITEANTTAEGTPASTANNITNITIKLPSGVLYVNFTGVAYANAFGANFSTVGYNFSNDTATTRQVLRVENTTTDQPLVKNQTTKWFWFNVSVAEPGTYALTVNISYNATATTGSYVWNSTNVTLTVNDITNPVATNMSNLTGIIGEYNTSAQDYLMTPYKNITYNFTNFVNFSCNSSDNVQLASVVLYAVGVNGAPTYTNTSLASGTQNQTNFTQLILQPGTYKFSCQAIDTTGLKNSSANYTLTVNAFSLSGYVKNSTYNNFSGANVSIYEYVMSSSGPPTETIIKSVTTGAGGNFTINSINQSYGGMNYKVKVTINDSVGNVIEVGPSLPPMPRQALLYSMNGGTFTTQTATTLRLYAFNNISVVSQGIKNTIDAMNFGYEVIDQTLGFPIESNVRTSVATADVIVPTNRNYTILFVRDPASFVTNSTCTEGVGAMSRYACPAPPVSVSITSNQMISLQNTTGWDRTNESVTINSTQSVVTINKSLAFTQVVLSGCLNIIGNTTETNLTNLTYKMIPWEGFMPPIKGDISDFNVTSNASYIPGLNGTGLVGNGKWNCTLGSFNLTLMGASSGINWMVEAYANGTNEYFAAFQNLTMGTTDKRFNLTLKRLLGQYSEGRTNKVEVIIQDDNGTAPQSATVEVYVRSPVFGAMHYIIETLSANGRFNISLINDTTEAKIRVYSNMYAPRDQTLNLSANRTNVTLYSFRPQKILADGTISSSKAQGTGMSIKFMKYSTACNVFTPASSCQIGDSKNGNFDPLQAMMGGKTNLMMKSSASNISLYFINVDMLASGPPDALMNDNASNPVATSTNFNQLWKFGSLAPDVYEKVIIGIPYSTAANEEDFPYYFNITYLYNENMKMIWNGSVNTTAQLPSEYSDYDTNLFGNGLLCTKSGTA
ncbi:MAG: hypothetical protein V1886_04390, partial [archaeon]